MLRRTFLTATQVLVLTLTACSPSGGDRAQQSPDSAIRIPLPSKPASPELAPQQPEGAVWALARNGAVDFGLPGQPPLLSISCTHAPDGTARIAYVRRTRAEAGAKALLAVEGNRHVARVAMDVVRAGDPGEWQGAIDAALETAEAIKGGASMTATLPGGGALKLPPSPDAGRLLDACRASDRKAGPSPMASVAP
ncbi:MAG: hypothetical protein ABIW31_04110 [Novosphingobium sp.]